MNADQRRVIDIFGRELTGFERLIGDRLHGWVWSEGGGQDHILDLTNDICEAMTAALDYWVLMEAFEERAALRTMFRSNAKRMEKAGRKLANMTEEELQTFIGGLNDD